MKRGWVWAKLGCGALAVITLGCGGGGGGGGDDEPHPAMCPPTLSYELTAKPFVAKYCVTCHGQAVVDRRGAPRGANFDDLAGLRAHGTMVHSYVQAGRMPPPEQPALPQPSAQERDDFVAWTVCAGLEGEHAH